MRQYYLDGIRLGLEYCELDGIRLDNNYNKTCYCEQCQNLFQTYLKDNYPKEKALHVFGIYPLTECRLVPQHRPQDPLYQAMTHFSIDRLNAMMQLLYQQVKAIRPEAIFGGNPAVFRSPSEICLKNNVYVPELFEGLAFGGHVPVTVWGIRMDRDEYNTLYRRPEFLEATKSVADFIANNGEIFRGLVSDAWPTCHDCVELR